MSVLNRKELADSPLADLHQIASELGVEGYRAMRKDDLIGAILGESGGSEEPAAVAVAEVPEEPSEDEPGEAEADVVEEEPEVVEDQISDDQIATGVLDVLANGSGFVRVDPA